MELIKTQSPHLRAADNTSNIMLDVIIALAPATVFGVVMFGFSALLTIATCVASAVASEALCCFFAKKSLTTSDLSAVVTGLILALNLPAGIPLYIAALGSVFAIVICKVLFGGLGKNIVNPAIGGRVFLLAAFSSAMTTFKEPFSDVVASATPLVSGEHSVKELFFGVTSGSIGETSAMMLLLGGVYLVSRKIIRLEIPLAFIGTVAVIAAAVGQNPLTAVLSGGLLLGAIFMATDYVTSPMSSLGKIVFGIGCGILTMAIRLFASLPEGVSYSILVMNLLTPLIDRYFLTHPFGAGKVYRPYGAVVSELFYKVVSFFKNLFKTKKEVETDA